MGRRLAVLALLAGAVVAFLTVRGSDSNHTLRAGFTSALQIRPGQYVEVAGRKVGSVRSAKLVDGRAVVTMDIDDEAWPLHRGTVAKLRYGTPLGYASRYVDLVPGPRAEPELPDGGVLTEADTITPVEFDEVPRVFGPRTRQNLARLLRNASAALHGTAPDLQRLLDEGAPGAQGVAGYTSELANDPHALRLLLAASAAANAQVARNEEHLGPLVRDAAATFDALNARSSDVSRMLDEAPGTLREGRRVLDHLDRTSDGLERLSRAFKPGAKELRALAPIAARVTDSMAVLAPRFAELLRTGADTLPALQSFMRRGRADVPVAGRALAGITDAIGCIRPYTPELAGYLTTSNGANAGYDANGHYIRLGLSTYPATVPSTMTPWQMTQSFSTVHYAMPRPPGLNGGQPWYQPDCGITPAGLNASGDREGGK